MDHESDNETAPLLVIEAPQQPKKRNFCHVLREEFRLKNFCFDFPVAGVFYKNQWGWPRLVFVLFRLCLAIYTGTICILTISYFPRSNPNRPWPIWLTNWSYLVLTLHQVLAALVVLVHSTDKSTGFCCREPETPEAASPRRDGEGIGDDGETVRGQAYEGEPVTWYMKLDWLVFCVASCAAVFVASSNVIILIKDIEHELPKVTVKGLNNHYLNGLVVLIEFCIAAIPVRLLHVIYVTIFYCLYFLFSLAYWSIDHTGNVIYPEITDWDDPRGPLKALALFALVFTPLVHIILFLVYQFRRFIYRKIFGESEARKFEPVYAY